MVTLKEIAAQCGCSVATVSKALNGLKDISPATSERIRIIASEMGYFPNSAARTLKTNRSRTLGLLMFLGATNVWSHGYFSKIASSVQEVAEERGYDIAPINCTRPSIMGSYLDYCRYRGYDGLIVMSTGFEDQRLVKLLSSELPVITIDYTVHNRGAVQSDNVQGMRLLVEYVHTMGHRRIAFIHGDNCAVTSQRLASFYATCEELEIDVPDEYVLAARFHDLKSTASATRQLLVLPERPTCILYQDDYSYMGGMRALMQAGLRIPEDISVTGYDGIEMAELVYPRLTTFQQDSVAIGHLAAEMLLDAIEKPRTFIPRHVTFPGRLVVGETVRNLNRQ